MNPRPKKLRYVRNRPDQDNIERLTVGQFINKPGGYGDTVDRLTRQAGQPIVITCHGRDSYALVPLEDLEILLKYKKPVPSG